MKVLLGMSGGVDSAYAAMRLSEMGYSVEGAVIKMHEYTEISDAEACAASLGIPLHIIDGAELFSSVVKENFIHEYSRGRTPNPCIVCNERVKFRLLYDYALEHGFDRIATGHYARIVRMERGGAVRYAVERTDSPKDQSYMLYRLPQNVLEKLVLPLSDIEKDKVREQTRLAGLSVSEKKDSMEICFLPEGRHYEFVEATVGDRLLGNFVNTEGKILAPHEGICRYTVGQRKGLGISLGERAFVVDIDPSSRNITLSERYSGKRECVISDVVFSGILASDIPLFEDAGDGEMRFDVKIRYTSPLEKCAVYRLDDGRVLLKFSNELRVAKGQSAVVYKDGCVMLGGVIDGDF